jgi:hypothetical protein
MMASSFPNITILGRFSDGPQEAVALDRDHGRSFADQQQASSDSASGRATPFRSAILATAPKANVAKITKPSV